MVRREEGDALFALEKEKKKIFFEKFSNISCILILYGKLNSKLTFEKSRRSVGNTTRAL